MTKPYRWWICSAIFLVTLSALAVLVSIVGAEVLSGTGIKNSKPQEQQLDFAQVACANPLDVSSTADDVNTCGTLRYALAYLTANPGAANKTITFSLPVDSRIALSGSGLVVPAGVRIEASCGGNTPDIVLDGSGVSGSGLTLGGQNVSDYSPDRKGGASTD